MISRVHAPHDDRLETYRLVGDPAALRARGLFVAEGRLVVRRLLEDGRFEVESVLVTPTAFEALAVLLARSGARVLVCEPATVSAITGFNFHRGCLAIARRPAEPALDALVSARRLFALERVGNPDNMGGIFRVASALGAGGIVLDAGSGDPYYRKAVRTSMGAALRVPFTRVPSLDAALRSLRESGFTLVALTPADDAVDIGAIDRGDRLVLMLGAEGAGLTPETQALADLRVRIPVAPDADSLNVVVAAGIALHALR